MKGKQKGNGLGENKVPAWSPTSVGDYSRGLQQTQQKNVPDEKRKGAGAKQ